MKGIIVGSLVFVFVVFVLEQFPHSKCNMV